MGDFAVLMNKIPELAFEVAKPTMDDFIANDLRKFHLGELNKLSHLEAARQPILDKQLTQLKVKFEYENSSLTEADKDTKWAMIEEGHYLDVQTDL
jgi:hypothetical protein